MNKYHSKKVEYDGINFASRLERDRYIELKQLEKAGIIKNLQLQVKYEVIPKQKGERAANYIADFVYEDAQGVTVVEDTKGFRTRDFILKRKLMLYVYGIKVQEVTLDERKKHKKEHGKKQICLSQGQGKVKHYKPKG